MNPADLFTIAGIVALAIVLTLPWWDRVATFLRGPADPMTEDWDPGRRHWTKIP